MNTIVSWFFIIAQLYAGLSNKHNGTAATHRKHRRSNVTEESSYCTRPWPQLELFLPVSYGYVGKYAWRNNEMERFFLRSFMLVDLFCRPSYKDFQKSLSLVGCFGLIKNLTLLLISSLTSNRVKILT